MRRLTLLLTVALMVGACAAETVTRPTTTVAVAEPSTTTTTVMEAAKTTDAVESATTEAEGSVDICSRSVGWLTGTSYVADCFVVPVSFEPVGQGWRSSGAGEEWMKVVWADPDDQSLTVRIGLMSYRSSEAPADVIKAIVASEVIAAVSSVEEVTVAGFRALRVDVEGDPEPGGEAAAPGSGGCTGNSPVWFAGTSFGHSIIGVPSGVMGVGACDRVRLWVLDAGGKSITIIAGTADPDRHTEAVAKVEELFEGMSFEVGAGS